MQTVALILYLCGFTGFFVLHQAFDGGFLSAKEGPLVGFVFALLWPLLVIMALLGIAYALLITAIKE